MRTVGVVTTSRADYGIFLPILRKARGNSEVRLDLIVSGMHLVPDFGLTVREIEEDGFRVDYTIDMLLASDSPEAIGKSIGLGVASFAQLFKNYRPDMLLVLGDRFEMFSAVVAALQFKIPVAHIHGGELTLGAIDECLRHSITKLSHLHFVATEEYGRRVRQLGEEPWRVSVVGAPSLDNLAGLEPIPRRDFEILFGLPQGRPFLLVTFHPTTLEYENARAQALELVRSLEATAMPALVTLPNADSGGRAIREVLEAFGARSDTASVVDSLGTRAYLSAMKYAEAMVGNSSSGIIEAASFRLPVVNIGSRQSGRVRASNVIDVGNAAENISSGIRRALSKEFRSRNSTLTNLYGDGRASDRIVEVLRSVDLKGLIPKEFVDIGEGRGA